MEKTSINKSVYDKLKGLISGALANNKSIACWKLPNDEIINLLVSDEVEKLTNNYRLEDLEKGFLFAPFYQKFNDIYFLKSSFYWNTLDHETEIPDEPQEVFFHNSKERPLNTPNEHYLRIVEKSIQKINEGLFEKVVPARVKTTHLNEDFDVIDFFLKLAEQYSDAFVSLVSIPQVGTWLCASPELLIQVQDNIFKTVSLAGTQPYEPTQPIRDTSWTQKEIEEQALVSRYIINCFKKIRLRDFSEFGPKTVRAGNLLHLKTEFQVDLKATNYPDLGSDMIKLLHPTSAVCGMPIDEAFQFLKENEDFDRSFYSGYLGPINFNNSTNLFVNLRCLQIVDNQIITYAGAGVTIDSNPAKELNETEIKMNTLIRMLK